MNYTEVFGQLKTNNKYQRKSPHKAVLLLTIIYMYEHDLLSENKIYYDEKLKNTYYNIWNIVLPNEPLFHPDLYMPFWFLQNDKFWHIIPKSGSEERIVEMRNSKSKPSETFIRNNVEYAELDDDLYFLITLPSGRSSLKIALLETYTNLSGDEIKAMSEEAYQLGDSSVNTNVEKRNDFSRKSTIVSSTYNNISDGLLKQFQQLDKELQIAFSYQYFSFLRTYRSYREKFEEIFPNAYVLYDRIVHHSINKNDITPSFSFMYENFLSDLKITLISEENSTELIDAINNAIDYLHKDIEEDTDNNIPISSEEGDNIDEIDELKYDEESYDEDLEVEHVYLDYKGNVIETKVGSYNDKSNNSNSNESRKGQPWTNEEEELITLYFNQGKDFDFIANKVGRTEVAIKSRLAKLGLIEYTYGENQVTYIQQPKQDNNMEPFYVIGQHFDDLCHWLGTIKFWSLNEMVSKIKIEDKWINKIVFSAKSHCAARGINYAEYFCDLPTDTLVTDYGLYHFFKAIPATPDIVPDTQHEVIAAQDYFEMPDPPKNNPNKFLHADPNANDFFLFPGDKVRILKEVGQSRGLMGATGVVQYHTYDTLSIIGPFQFFCNREDVELIERKKR